MIKIYADEAEFKDDYKSGQIVERYIIIAKSVSYHCCFSHTIIDTKSDDEEIIAECFEEGSAIIIVTALNAWEDQK